eukprot:TRINITY_DN32849_c0_g1_i1.p1 TRINITY_DN32849_c0_g1~~TRINITY_DN32849_c0_g1_i1.p1  ORF type:complete len:1843 (+),score=215.88 TRINITY_DN32849_c0_g1_i1:371-5530(+)
MADPRPHNVARVWVVGAFVTGGRYGFRLRLRNPPQANVSAFPLGDWALRTRDQMGALVDSTNGTIPSRGGEGRTLGPWLLYNRTMESRLLWDMTRPSPEGAVAIGVSSMLPSILKESNATATLHLVLPANLTRVILRIVAPEGFLWSVEALQLRPEAPYDNATHDFPVAFNLSRSMGNMLVSDVGDFVGGALYGFSAPLYVPRFAPVRSAQSFFVDASPAPTPPTPEPPSLLPDDGGDVALHTVVHGVSAVIPSAPVRSIVDTSVRASNRLPRASVDLLFQVRLATPVAGMGGKLQVSVPPNYTLDEKCELMPWPGRVQWDEDEAFAFASCDWDNLTRNITIRPAVMGPPLHAALLRFRITAVNPDEPFDEAVAANLPSVNFTNACGDVPCWKFQTSQRIMGDGVLEFTEMLDAPQVAVGLDVAEMMYVAELMDFRHAQRDDRLGRPNVLVFRFQLMERKMGSPLEPLMPGVFELVGPPGFVFEERCLPRVENRRYVIFGSARIADLWKVEEWERGAAVLECHGNLRIAAISVAGGLHAGRAYALSVGLTNPMVIPERNNWTLSFQNFFSQPIRSFDIWTFPELRLIPFSTHSGPSCYAGQCIGAGINLAVPLTLRFRVQSTVSTRGELQLESPLGFGFAPTIRLPKSVWIDEPRMTPCSVFQYWNGNFSTPPEQWRNSDLACIIKDMGQPLTGTGTGDFRTLRLVLKYVKSEFEDRDPRALMKDSVYDLIMQVDPPGTFRPAEHWTVRSFDPEGNLVDVGTVMGYELKKVLIKFEHSNQEYNFYTYMQRHVVVEGLFPIPDFVFDFELADPAWQSDTIMIIGPPGFTFERNATGACIDIRWLLPQEIDSPPANCVAETLVLPLSSHRSGIQSRVTARLWLGLSNPEKPPPDGTNYWRIQHVSGLGSLVSAAMAMSWPIIPRLTRPSALLTGELMAAGAVTTITFAFTSVLPASELLVEALEPPGFELDGVFVTGSVNGGSLLVPQVLLAKGPSLRVVVAGLSQPYVNISLDAAGARMPVFPVATKWRLSTYRLSLEPEDYGEAYIRDEVIFEGFRVPGRITVMKASARTPVTTRSGPAIFSVAVLGGMATEVTLHLNVSSELLTGDALIVSLEGAGQEGFLVDVDSASDGLPILVEGSSGGPISRAPLARDYDVSRSIAVYFGSSVAAGALLGVTFPMLTPRDRTNFYRERWRIQAFRGAYTASRIRATNDATPFSLAVVTMLPTEPKPFSRHRPPLSTIEVSFVLDPLDTGADFMILQGPPGFVFEDRCLAPENELAGVNVNISKDSRCFTLPTPVGIRSMARLDCGGGASAGVECLRRQEITVLVNTPRRTPEALQNIWFVEALGEVAAADLLSGAVEGFGQQLGRTEFAGFELDVMECDTTYASISAVPVDISISFRSRVPLPPRSSILIQAPPELTDFTCGSRSRGLLAPLSLGKVLSCSGQSKPWSITVRLNDSLRAGLHAFTVPSESARVDPYPSTNIFEVFLRGPDDDNRDVALLVPGEPVIYGIRTTMWPLRWKLGPDTSVPISITIQMEVFDDSDLPVYGILIALPRDPAMSVASAPGDIQVDTSLGSALPLLRVTVREDKNSVLLMLDGQRHLERGFHNIRLSVVFPANVSRFNVWRVALCNQQMEEIEGQSSQSTCTLSGFDRGGRGSAVFAVFALAGFDPNDRSVGKLPVVAGAPSSIRPFPRLVCFWFLAKLLAVAVGGGGTAPA